MVKTLHLQKIEVNFLVNGVVYDKLLKIFEVFKPLDLKIGGIFKYLQVELH